MGLPYYSGYDMMNITVDRMFEYDLGLDYGESNKPVYIFHKLRREIVQEEPPKEVLSFWMELIYNDMIPKPPEPPTPPTPRYGGFCNE